MISLMFFLSFILMEIYFEFYETSKNIHIYNSLNSDIAQGACHGAISNFDVTRRKKKEKKKTFDHSIVVVFCFPRRKVRFPKQSFSGKYISANHTFESYLRARRVMMSDDT